MMISWSIGSEKSFGHVPPVGVEPNDFSYPFCLNIGVKYHVISRCYFRMRYFHMPTTSFLRLAYRSTPYSRFCYHVIHTSLRFRTLINKYFLFKDFTESPYGSCEKKKPLIRLSNQTFSSETLLFAFSVRFFLFLSRHTQELQRLEHIWNHENIFKTG